MSKYNINTEIETNESNYSSSNPINRNDVKRKKINGVYVYERFYLIDFLGIRENSYVISSFGRIFSLISNKELTPTINSKKNGYRTVELRTNKSKCRNFVLHRLVAIAFVPKTAYDKKMKRNYVHHKNWDNDYNYHWNLDWDNRLELSVKMRIQNNSNLEESDIAKFVCQLLERGNTIADIYDLLERRISKDKISKIKNRTIYKNLSSSYRF